jgi:hypothetical protein
LVELQQRFSRDGLMIRGGVARGVFSRESSEAPVD